MSAGVYLYQFRAGNRTETKKMLLLDGGSVSQSVKPSWNSGTQSVAKTFAEKTYSIRISGDRIIPYEKTGVTIIDGQKMDFVVELLGEPLINGITFASIPAGSFQMGDETGDLWSGCRPVHSVTVSGFEMSVYEITQGQYKSVTGTSPSDNGHGVGDNYPVNMVSWWDAIKYCNALSVKSRYQPCYNESTGDCDFSKNGFRLPTEAEWEYACRAGSRTRYNLGDVISDLDRAGWYENNSGYTSHPAGQKTPNAWGLYDMHGNVWEWCNDWYENYSSASQSNPTGAQTGSSRMIRGGNWSSSAHDCRSARRFSHYPDNGDYIIGFRVVRRASPQNY